MLEVEYQNVVKKLNITRPATLEYGSCTYSNLLAISFYDIAFH